MKVFKDQLILPVVWTFDTRKPVMRSNNVAGYVMELSKGKLEIWHGIMLVYRGKSIGSRPKRRSQAIKILIKEIRRQHDAIEREVSYKDTIKAYKSAYKNYGSLE